MPRSHPLRSTILLAAAALCLLLAPPARAGGAAHTGTATACPARGFERFLAAFERSADTQRAFTKLPLPTRRVDLTADPEPAPVDEVLAPEAVRFPVFPDAKKRKHDHLTMKIDKPAPDRAQVLLTIEDTGYAVLFLFERGACWQLVMIDDRST